MAFCGEVCQSGLHTRLMFLEITFFFLFSFFHVLSFSYIPSYMYMHVSVQRILLKNTSVTWQWGSRDLHMQTSCIHGDMDAFLAILRACRE